jgi:hemolysin activation/secretion protein
MLSISGGAVYRSIEDQLILTSDGESDYETDARKINLVPLSIAVSYSSARPDALKGRNFVTAQTSAEFEDFAGSSSEEELQSLRANADGSYYIEKLQLARIQTLFDGGKGGDTAGQWLLFAKADGQLASGPLVPAEQKAIGGMDTVRGFPERIVQGDHGVSGCLELRTPLFSTFTRSPYKSADDRRKALNEGKTVDKFQFVTFVDAGYVKYEEALTDTYDYTIASVGAGLRLALTSHAQLRFDWGVPIAGRDDVSSDSTEEVDSGGRYHLSAQVQF